MNAESVRNVKFDIVRKGYSPASVDEYLTQVAAELDALYDERDAALEDLDLAREAQTDLESKILILAQKVEEYRSEEDTLKTALLNAQRMGETVVHEAKQKADSLVREATGTAQLLREQAEEESARERLKLEQLQAQVTRFKATILNLYKQHIESLSALDEPIEQIEDVREAYVGDEAGFQEIVQEEMMHVVEFEAEEPELPDNKVEAAQAAGIETQPPELGEEPMVNLFEGVPIDPSAPSAPSAPSTLS